MAFGKKKILGVFLEKDNLKFLLFNGPVRIFAGQITFSPEVVHDGFIADAEKFSSQVKIAYAQKVALHEAPEVVLFVSPDKAFTKTLPGTDSVDSFIHGLPYFKEELVISEHENKDKTITYLGFEKKLIEDLQRPFLDMGKKVLAVKSPANILAERFSQIGKYLLLASMDKEVVVIVAENGVIVDSTVIKNEVFAARFPEFKAAHNIVGNSVYVVGVFPSHLTANLGLQIVPLAQSDIYDIVFNASLAKGKELKLPQVNQKYVFLAGAILAGVLLVLIVVKNMDKLKLLTSSVNKKPVSPITTPIATSPPVIEPKPADFSVAILNGTLVTGEASKLADKLKSLGFEITETKNATSAGFVTTRLRFVKTVPEKITAQLDNVLAETYESVVLEPMASSSGKAVVEIIIGKKK